MIIKSTRFILIDKPGSANKTSKTDPGLYDGVLPAQMTVALLREISDMKYDTFSSSLAHLSLIIFFF